jgi:hypothetical protein
MKVGSESSFLRGRASELQRILKPQADEKWVGGDQEWRSRFELESICFYFCWKSLAPQQSPPIQTKNNSSYRRPHPSLDAEIASLYILVQIFPSSRHK